MNGLKGCALSPCAPEEVGEYLMRVKKTGCFLDAGCGRGELLSWLSSHSDYLLYGSEPDTDFQNAASARCPNAMISSDRMESLSWRDRQFDLMYYGCTFSLSERPDDAWAEIDRTLREDGRVVIADVFSKSDSNEVSSDLARWFRAEREIRSLGAAHGFACADFRDATKALRQWLFQSVWNQTGDGIAELAGHLKSIPVGYGFWTFARA